MKPHFYCYSARLREALIVNGFECIGSGVNPSTGSTYWLYDNTPEFNIYKNNIYPLERDKFPKIDYKENQDA